jgi:DNA polymerase (family X)
MKNLELAKIFYDIAERLKMEGVSFRPQAYQKAALSLEALKDSVESVYKKGGVRALMDIPGVGESIADLMEQYIKTGKIRYYNELKKKVPVDLEEITKIEGMGPMKAKALYQKLGIRNLKELEKAAKAHKIAGIEGFGEKTEKNILEGISFVKRSKGRFLLGKIMPEVKDILKNLENIKGVKKISLAGSSRRMRETVGDIDILAVAENPKKIMDFFVSMQGVEKVWANGSTRSSLRMESGFDIDLRVVPEKSYGSALQYFTGSKDHNIATRKIAMEKGLKLNEYGVFNGAKMIAGKTEEEIYDSIGLKWIPPELRENDGEIEAVLNNRLPKLIDLKDIKGDLHCHSNWDGGENSIEEMAQSAIEMGYEYIGISDHTKFLHIENGLSEEQLLSQKKEISDLNSKLKIKNSEFKVLHGCEANILKGGEIDIKDEVLAQLDYVIAGVHSAMKENKEDMTRRIIKAMENPNVDIISHPTGRLIGERDEYQINFDAILAVAKRTGTILEINASPQRLDLKAEYIRKAKYAGVKMIIGSDSHDKNWLKFMEYGVGQARRGWAEKGDIINTESLDNIIKYFI